MDTNELKERLNILAQNNVISFRAASLTMEAFGRLQEVLHKEEIEGSQMLFTHLSTAITRIERGEEIGAPMPEILTEIQASEFYPEVLQQVNFIEKLHGASLPQEERDYLTIHYTNVFQQNEGGTNQ